jgi:hypothetical protein
VDCRVQTDEQTLSLRHDWSLTGRQGRLTQIGNLDLFVCRTQL